MRRQLGPERIFHELPHRGLLLLQIGGDTTDEGSVQDEAEIEDYDPDIEGGLETVVSTSSSSHDLLSPRYLVDCGGGAGTRNGGGSIDIA